MRYFLCTLLFLSILPSFAKTGNKVIIDIKHLDYKRPENNKGNGGLLNFHKVKMTWDDMKVSLNNTDSFLESTIKVRPTYVKFQTPGMGISFPMQDNPTFFSIESVQLEDSKFLLNQDFFNFDGERFVISDGTSKLVLDKFNMYCKAPDEIDMTSMEGLIHGCLTELILNGKNETDLAGAKMEYFDNSDKKNGFYLTSRLKDLTLSNRVIALDLQEGQIDVGDFNINLGKTYIECEKKESIIELDVDGLKNSCLNNIGITAPQLKVKDKKEGSEFGIKLESLKVTNNKFIADINKVALKKEDSTTFLNNLKISCSREKDSEFYDLHKTIAGCVKEGKITINTITSNTVGIKEEEEKGFFSGWFSSEEDPEEKQKANNININIVNNKLEFYSSIDLPYIPRFRLSFEAHVEHDPDAGTLSLDIIRFKAIKLLTLRKALLLMAYFTIDGMDKITVDSKKITIQL